MQFASPLNGLRRLRQRPAIAVILASAIGLNLAQWAFLIARVRPQADPITLHYTIAFGIDRIGSWYRAYILSASGTAMLLANLLLAALVVEHQRATASLVLILTIFIQAILLAGAILVFRPL